MFLAPQLERERQHEPDGEEVDDGAHELVGLRFGQYDEDDVRCECCSEGRWSGEALEASACCTREDSY